MQTSARFLLVCNHLVELGGKRFNKLEDLVSWLIAGQSFLDPWGDLGRQCIGPNVSPFCWLRRACILSTLQPYSLRGRLVQLVAVDLAKAVIIFAFVVGPQVGVHTTCLECRLFTLLAGVSLMKDRQFPLTHTYHCPSSIPQLSRIYDNGS